MDHNSQWYKGHFLRFFGGYRKVPGVRRERRGSLPLALVLPLALSSRLTYACPRLKKKFKNTTLFKKTNLSTDRHPLDLPTHRTRAATKYREKRFAFQKKNLFNGEKVLHGVRTWHIIETIISNCFFAATVRIFSLREVSQLASS